MNKEMKRVSDSVTFLSCRLAYILPACLWKSLTNKNNVHLLVHSLVCNNLYIFIRLDNKATLSSSPPGGRGVPGLVSELKEIALTDLPLAPIVADLSLDFNFSWDFDFDTRIMSSLPWPLLSTRCLDISILFRYGNRIFGKPSSMMLTDYCWLGNALKNYTFEDKCNRHRFLARIWVVFDWQLSIITWLLLLC